MDNDDEDPRFDADTLELLLPMLFRDHSILRSAQEDNDPVFYATSTKAKDFKIICYCYEDSNKIDKILISSRFKLSEVPIANLSAINRLNRKTSSGRFYLDESEFVVESDHILFNISPGNLIEVSVQWERLIKKIQCREGIFEEIAPPLD